MLKIKKANILEIGVHLELSGDNDNKIKCKTKNAKKTQII